MIKTRYILVDAAGLEAKSSGNKNSDAHTAQSDAHYLMISTFFFGIHISTRVISFDGVTTATLFTGGA